MAIIFECRECGTTDLESRRLVTSFCRDCFSKTEKKYRQDLNASRLVNRHEPHWDMKLANKWLKI